ncbi:19325_t:CDS:2 [Funneliformis geosporum]|uniref:19325_t:CDS:1 n=1 Tax=Funneliformis geosporum TaxID=1117311 RepID=A0A9W4SPA4_9GLOM|nr:19325_t:CDS:2 [Funneliformis geosporum]
MDEGKSFSKISDLNTRKFEQKREYEEKIQQLETNQNELKIKLKELDDEVWMEREEAEKALNTTMKWRKRQMFETVLKHDASMGKLLDRIDLLENNLAVKNQEIDWRNYLENKELPTLPERQKKNRLRKIKQLVNKDDEQECNFCFLDFDDPTNFNFDTAPAIHQMVARNTPDGYSDIVFICAKSTKPLSDKELISQSFSSRLENKTRELEEELTTTKEELNIEREEITKFHEIVSAHPSFLSMFDQFISCGINA